MTARRVWAAVAARLFGLGRERRGNITAMTALLIVPLVGAMGMAVETSDWYLNQRALQNAADSAALSAGMNGGTGAGSLCSLLPGNFDCEAKAVAAKYGFVDGANNVTVTVTCMAKTATGSCTAGTCPGGAIKCYKVAITKKLPLSIMQIVGYTGTTTVNSQNGVTLYASSTSEPAAAAQTGGCMLAIGSSNQSGAIDISGGANIQAPNCGVYDDSTSNTALIATNSGTINASGIYVSGGLSESGAPNLSPTPTTNSTAASDPYAGATAPTVGSNCDQTNYSIGNGNKANINASGSTPYIFCGGFSAQGAAVVTFGAGTYVIKGGTFSVSNGATVTASQGSTFYLTGGATLSLSGGTTTTITAPSSGNYAGIAIWDDSGNTTGSAATVSFSNGATLDYVGVLYLPGHTLNVTGGFGNTPGKCSQIIADVINVSNGITLNSNCANTGVKPIGTNGSSGGSATLPRLIL